ncbi:MAG TPA: hypothetical protein VFW30_04960 [Bryocella sp.]|nr:hypothetical protein [Bryocella sp.]
MRMWRLAFTFMLISMPMVAQVQEEPLSKEEVAMFARYHVDDVFRGKPTMPDMRDPDVRMYGTRLRYAAEHGANFAGHYAMAVWGCGSGCIVLAAIDLRSGKVTYFPGAVSWDREKNYGVRFQKNSRAIHAVGALNEEDSADRWYVWTGQQFKLIAKKPAELEPDEPDTTQ